LPGTRLRIRVRVRVRVRVVIRVKSRGRVRFRVWIMIRAWPFSPTYFCLAILSFPSCISRYSITPRGDNKVEG
jgi:hypothetical protein